MINVESGELPPLMQSPPRMLTPLEFQLLQPAERERYVADIDAELEKRAGYKMRSYFRDNGPYRRELYPKHMQLVGLGIEHRERLFLAGNRVGKSDLGAYETDCHLTGLYPAWWHGRKFQRAISSWAAGSTKETVRDIIQPKLIGPEKAYGTGMIPSHCIHHITPGEKGGIDKVWVKWANSAGDVVGLSELGFKSYDQKRKAFEGTEKDLVWMDEEPPQDIYTECVVRTMTTDGLILCTFTPLQGTTALILQFLKPDDTPMEIAAQGTIQ